MIRRCVLLALSLTAITVGALIGGLMSLGKHHDEAECCRG